MSAPAGGGTNPATRAAGRSAAGSTVGAAGGSTAGSAQREPGVATSGPAARFQSPRSSYLAVLFLGLGLTPLVRSLPFVALYLIPVAVGVFVARRATLVNGQRVRVQGLLGSRSVAWGDVRGVLISPRRAVSLVDHGGSSLRLPFVRVRHVPLLSELSSGRLPDPSADGAVRAAPPADDDDPRTG